MNWFIHTATSTSGRIAKCKWCCGRGYNPAGMLSGYGIQWLCNVLDMSATAMVAIHNERGSALDREFVNTTDNAAQGVGFQRSLCPDTICVPDLLAGCKDGITGKSPVDNLRC